MVPAPEAMACPVCRGSAISLLLRDGERTYWACGHCEARFLDPRQHPSGAEERAHYALHQNELHDPGYRRFLSRLSDPLLVRLPPASSGLDYGCGPGPALAAMLGECGHQVALYDPFFVPDEAVLRTTYDFVTCTEVAEHFHRPALEFGRMAAMVKPGGWLAIMTCFQTDDTRFARWHYRMDPTHVVFYREATMRWLANRYGFSCEIPVKDVALMQRPMADAAE